MKWRIYAAAAVLTAMATYPQLAETGFSTEGGTSWLIKILAGGALWGFVGSWICSKWKKPSAGS